MRYVIVPGLVGSVSHGWELFYGMDIDTYSVIPGSDATAREDVPLMIARYYPHSQEMANDNGTWTPVTSAAVRESGANQ